jgi:ComF family protein
MILRPLLQYLDSLKKLVYPELCMSCMNRQPVLNDVLCVHCDAQLSPCNFESLKDNLIHWRLGSRLLPTWASAYIYFKTGNTAQTLLHRLKYTGKQEIGSVFGERHGQLIVGHSDYIRPDYIIPVPLHSKRLHQRGYNQSAVYAHGLNAYLSSEVREDLLIRNRYTETQTSKSRIDRIRNVDDAFRVKDPHRLEGKLLLLVDDVFTSGATLESCAIPLLQIPGIQLAIATLAIADDW